MAGEITSQTLIDQVRRYLQGLGMRTGWVERLGRSRIFDVKLLSSFDRQVLGYNCPTYEGRTLYLPPGHVDPNDPSRVLAGHLPKMVHELWHVYCDQLLEKDAPALAAELKQVEKTSIAPQVVAQPHGKGCASDAPRALDEVVGWYLEACAEKLEQLRNPLVTRNDRDAQETWDELLSPRTRKPLLSADYDVIRGPYILPAGVARSLRRKFFGLPDDVRAWPEWHQAWPRPRSNRTIEQLAREIDRRDRITEKLRALAQREKYRDPLPTFHNTRAYREPHATIRRIDLGIEARKPWTLADLSREILERMVAGIYLWTLVVNGHSGTPPAGPVWSRPPRFRL